MLSIRPDHCAMKPGVRTHKSRKAENLGATLGERPRERGLEGCAVAAEGPVIDHRRRQTHGRGLVEAAGIGPVGKDEAHLGRMLRIGHVSRERDHVRPRSGNEDGNAPAERVWPTAQSTPR